MDRPSEIAEALERVKSPASVFERLSADDRKDVNAAIDSRRRAARSQALAWTAAAVAVVILYTLAPEAFEWFMPWPLVVLVGIPLLFTIRAVVAWSKRAALIVRLRGIDAGGVSEGDA